MIPKSSRRARVVAFVVVLGLVVAACSSGGDDGPSAGEGGPAETDGVLTGGAIAPGPNSPLSAVLTVSAQEGVRLEGSARSGDHEVVLPRTAEPADRHEYPVVGMRAEQTYDIELRAINVEDQEVGSATASFTTPALPDAVPELDVVTVDDRMSPGLTMFDVGQWDVADTEGRSTPLLLVLDEEGEIVWYYENFFTIGDSRQVDSGRILMNYPDFGAREVDILGNELIRWEVGDAAPEEGLVLVRDADGEGYGAMHHEVNPLPNGNLLTLTRRRGELDAAERERLCPGDPEEFVLREDFVVEFTRDGAVVNEWSLRDVIDPGEVPGTDLCEPGEVRDWAHANGALLDTRRNAIIVTARHIDMLFAFRYADDANGPSGALLWSIGPGGTLPVDGDVTYHPHAPELLPDGTILVYDNGNGRPGTSEDDPDNPTYSRAVRFAVDDFGPDPTLWRARQLWEHRVDDRDGTPLYADFLGDADLLDNGNVLIGHGGIGQARPPARGRIIEVVPDETAGGDVVFDVWLPDTWVSYRAERITGLYNGPDWVLPGS